MEKFWDNLKIVHKIMKRETGVNVCKTSEKVEETKNFRETFKTIREKFRQNVENFW